MDPILVQIGPLVIRWYGVMMALTILTSIVMAYRYGPRFGITALQLDRIAVPFILVAFIGARLGYVISHPAEFSNPVEILRVDHGGLSSHGAIASGLIAFWYVSRRQGVSIWSLAETAVWAIPVGNIFVRFGNFMNGELYGDLTARPWAVTFPGVPGPRHPLQLYEIVLAAIILAVALPLARRRAFAGQLFWTVIVLTSIGRIFLDLLRSEDRVWSVVTLGHIPAAVLITAGMWFLFTRRQAQ